MNIFGYAHNIEQHISAVGAPVSVAALILQVAQKTEPTHKVSRQRIHMYKNIHLNHE